MAYLFVYGTLQSGFKNPWQKSLSEQSIFVGPAEVKGAIYDLGEYPGAVRSEVSYIKGELYELPEDSKHLWQELDEYEGEEYERQKAKVVLKDSIIDVWIYWYIKSLKGKVLIKSGDYLQYMKAKESTT